MSLPLFPLNCTHCRCMSVCSFFISINKEWVYKSSVLILSDDFCSFDQSFQSDRNHGDTFHLRFSSGSEFQHQEMKCKCVNNICVKPHFTWNWKCSVWDKCIKHGFLEFIVVDKPPPTPQNLGFVYLLKVFVVKELLSECRELCICHFHLIESLLLGIKLSAWKLDKFALSVRERDGCCMCLLISSKVIKIHI